MRLLCSSKAITGAVMLAVPTIAHAQAYQCRAPSVSSVPVTSPDSQPRSVPTMGYTLPQKVQG